MADLIDIVPGPYLAQLELAFAELPEILQALLDDELEERADDIGTRARAAIAHGHPNARTPEHEGEWRWIELVNSIVAKTVDGAPAVEFGRNDLKGALLWEFGSDKFEQFEPHNVAGYFLGPSVRKEMTEGVKVIEAALKATITRKLE